MRSRVDQKQREEVQKETRHSVQSPPWLKALDAIIITGMSRPLPPPASRLCFWEDRKGLAYGQTEAEAETEATAAEKGRVRKMSNEYYSRCCAGC